MKKFLFLFLFSCITFFAKAGDTLAVFRNDLDSIRDNVSWINESAIFYDTINNNHFNRVDSLHPFGLGYRGPFPEKAIGINLDIEIEEYSTIESNVGELQLAISVLKGDSTIFWDSRNIQNQRTCLLQPINREIFSIPSNLVTPDNTFLIYFWSNDKTSSSLIDDLKITFTERASGVSFPNLLKKDQADSSKKLDVTLKNEKFTVLIDSSAKSILVLSNKGDTMISSVKVLFEFRNNYFRDGYNEPVLLENAKSIHFQDKLGNISVSLIYEFDTATVDVELSLNNLNGTVLIDGSVIFYKSIILNRVAIVVEYGMEVEHIIKENSESVVPSNNKSYWLKSGEIVFKGRGNNFISNSNASLSSLQIFPDKKNLLLNLDYSIDHPAIYFPKMKKSKNASMDHSAINYTDGNIIKGQFLLSPVDDLKAVAIMKNPNGYLSSIVWTEHADFSDIRTQRAVMFGSEEIHNADSAIGGFVGHGLLITKSVFYDNPTNEMNSQKDKRFKSPSVSIKQSPEFLDLLKQLKRKDFEICLHTPDPFTTKRELAEEAMKFMQANFATCNWIDHGYDNSSKSNREDVNCDGLDSTSESFVGDLFKKYGVKYNWSSYYEDNSTFKNLTFNSFLTTPYSGWDDEYSRPEYFRNPKDASLISWRTTFTLDPADGSLWNYFFDDTRLNDLVKSKGNCIFHCYLARVDSTNGFYSYEGNKIVINPEFDKVLAKLKKYQDENKIWVTTVEKMLDYRLQIEKVKILYLKNGQVAIYNDNDEAVLGLSIKTTARNISAGEKNIRLKKEGDETIAVFDLASKEKLILDLR